MFFCFSSNQRHAPSAKAQEIVKNFRMIMIAELIFAIMGILIGNMAGIYYLMKAIVIYCCYHGLDPTQCVVYECLTFFSIYLNLADLGLIFQNGWPIVTNDDYIDQTHLMYLLNLVFCIITIYPVFMGYREFKGIQYDLQNGRMSDGGVSISNPSVDYQMNSVNIPDGNPNSNIDQNESRRNILVEGDRDIEEEEEKKENEPNNLNFRNESTNDRNIEIPPKTNPTENLTKKVDPFENFEKKYENPVDLGPNDRGNNDSNNNRSDPFSAFSGRGVLIGSSG